MKLIHRIIDIAITTTKMLVLMTVVIIWVMVLFYKTTKDLYGANNCFVEGYETIYCAKRETDTHVIWKVIAEDGADVIVIEKALKKPLFQNLEKEA